MPPESEYVKSARYADLPQYYYNLSSRGTDANMQLLREMQRNDAMNEADESAEITASQSDALHNKKAIYEHIAGKADTLVDELNGMKLSAEKAHQKQAEAGRIAGRQRDQQMLEVQRVRKGAIDYLVSTSKQASCEEKYFLQESDDLQNFFRPSTTLTLKDMQAIMGSEQEQYTIAEVWTRTASLYHKYDTVLARLQQAEETTETAPRDRQRLASQPDVASPIATFKNELPPPLTYHNPFGFQDDAWVNSEGRFIFVAGDAVYTLDERNGQINWYTKGDIRLSMPGAYCIEISFHKKRQLLGRVPEFEAPFRTSEVVATPWVVNNFPDRIPELEE